MTRVQLQKGQAGLPTPESTKSFWHCEPSETLLGHRTTADLPSTAEVVVVGSGITGTFAAQELVNSGKNVLLLEAREACWGATGRNGGHCHPLIFLNKPHIAKFELANYNFIKDFIAKNNIPCDWRTVGGVCGLVTQEEADIAEEVTKLLHKHYPEFADKSIFYKDKKDLERLRMPNVHAAVLHPNAAKVWPYKLVAWVLEKLLRENNSHKFNLQTKTPVTYLQRAEGGSWVLHTERGQIVAKDVLLCTNAYTSHLLPKMTGLIRPVRGQVCALRPPKNDAPLEHSHVWTSGSASDNYLIQRDGSGILILGGERNAAADGQVDMSNDDDIHPDVSKRLHGACHEVLKLSPGHHETEKLEAAYEWTGIMGYSRDQHPWVGKVPEALGGGDGLWMSAAYTGHGMPAASRSGIATAQRILGKDVEVPVPPEFEISPERAERATAATEPDNLVEELRVVLAELKKVDGQSG